MRNNNKDFKEFLSAESVNPPKGLTENIFNAVNADLNPSPWKVFSKLTFIHFLSAFLTLSVCPQFGFRVLGSGAGFMGTFMYLGHIGCMIACGFFFLGTSFLIALLSLKIEEVKTVRKYRWVQISSLISISLGAFIMIDAADIIFSFGAAWALGNFIGAISILELGWFIRRKVLI